MNLPFTKEQFIDVFIQYNQSIWPAQVLAYVLGLLAVYFVFKHNKYSNRVNTLILAVFWLSIGIMYHWMFFAKINQAAFIFGGVSVLQGLFFLWAGLKDQVSYGFKKDIYSIVGLVFTAYATVIYPLIGYLLGHGYPKSPGFGVAPCPVTIFTFGLLLLTDKKFPKYLLFIPLIWSLIGFNAAIALGIREDIGLLVAGVVGMGMIVYRDKEKGKTVDS